MALCGREVEPDIRANVVFLHALTLPVHHAKPELRFRITFTSSALKPLPRKREALQRSTTVVVHRPKLGLRCNQILFCSPRYPLPRERGVRTRAGTIQMREPQLKLRLSNTLVRIRLELRRPDGCVGIGRQRLDIDIRRLRANCPR